MRLTAGRGTAHQPGRMLALKEGGRTTGVAYRLPEETLEQGRRPAVGFQIIRTAQSICLYDIAVILRHIFIRQKTRHDHPAKQN